MRSAKNYRKAYVENIPGAATGKLSRTIYLVDICLHFLAQYNMRGALESLPHLLEGYPQVFGGAAPLHELSILRFLASGYSSPMAWDAAVAEHRESGVETAYRTHDGRVEDQSVEIPGVRQMLDSTLAETPIYTDSTVKFAKPGDTHARLRKGGWVPFRIPQHSYQQPDFIDLPNRQTNPPITVSWSKLEETAKAIDKAESEVTWPAWLPPLNLAHRLARVRIDGKDPTFFTNNRVTLDGAHHIVGMLSSGKSTFLQTLLMTLAGNDYSKRILVLTENTVSAANTVARLEQHGIPASVISSVPRRDKHLAAIHWVNAEEDASNTLDATASMSRSFGLACPLEGAQQWDEDAFRFAESEHRQTLDLGDRPCTRLYQGASTKADGKKNDKTDKTDRSEIGAEPEGLTCPFITDCPTHNQQASLGVSRVHVMTAHAFLAMRPAAHVTGKNISFAELFQHWADVVLVDEVDSIQRIFDDAFCVQEPLLSASESTYLFETQRSVMESVAQRGGRQYANPGHSQWHARLGQLQTATALIYQILLKHKDEVDWLTENQAFTSASLLCDIWRAAQGSQDDKAKLDADQESDLRALAQFAGRMGASLVRENETVDSDSGHTAPSPNLAQALDQLPALQREIMTHGGLELEAIEHAITQGPLQVFDLSNKRIRNKRKGLVGSLRTTSLGIALALLTNACLGLFSWLAKSQGAVAQDFRLDSMDIFSTTRRMRSLYGALVPANPSGGAYGLMFERSNPESGGTLRLVHQLGVGRHLLLHMNRLLANSGQAGPHTVMLSGTSWAGGQDAVGPYNVRTSASPKFDVQLPVAAILRQPKEEVEAVARCTFKLGPVTNESLAVSGQPLEQRRANLVAMSRKLCSPQAGGSALELQWRKNMENWGAGMMEDRSRALIVTNNYADAMHCAYNCAEVSGTRHLIYVLVQDASARNREAGTMSEGMTTPQGGAVIELPRSKVEKFGLAPAGSILFAPIQVISRGHNILNRSGKAALSSIYFLHRPHPRPDDMDAVIAEANRFAMNVFDGHQPIPESATDALSRGKWLKITSRQLVNASMASRIGFSQLDSDGQRRFAWDLITLLWQTVGRGIRSGVPVHVHFVDSRFSPGAFADRQEDETESCLKRCMTTLREAMNAGGSNAEIVEALYAPFLGALEAMFEVADASSQAKPMLELNLA